jgi:hypothetical protein
MWKHLMPFSRQISPLRRANDTSLRVCLSVAGGRPARPAAKGISPNPLSFLTIFHDGRRSEVRSGLQDGDRFGFFVDVKPSAFACLTPWEIPAETFDSRIGCVPPRGEWRFIQ